MYNKEIVIYNQINKLNEKKVLLTDKNFHNNKNREVRKVRQKFDRVQFSEGQFSRWHFSGGFFLKTIETRV